MVVLYWIKNNKPWKQYVSHCIKEICQLTDTNQWYHCPGILNPADLPSRGTTVEKLVQSIRWWNGPAFLKLSQDKWPQTKISSQIDQSIQSALVKNSPAVSYAFSITDVDAVCSLISIIDCTHFSSVTRLLRVTALFCVLSASPKKTDQILINNVFTSRVCQFNWMLRTQVLLKETL